jgi:hypothetical protein
LVRRFRRPPRGAFGFLLGLDLVPHLLNVGWRQPAVLVGENMRVPSDHFARDCLDHIGKCECVLFLGHAGMEHHLQQEIAEFVAQVAEIVARDGFDDFVGFLDGVGRDRRKILFEVPRTAAAGRAQPRHDLEQT